MNNKNEELKMEKLLGEVLRQSEVEVPKSGLVRLLNSLPAQELLVVKNKKTFLPKFILFRNWKLVGTFAVLLIAVVFVGIMFSPKPKNISYNNQNIAPTAQNDVSDVAINQDLSNIDYQLAGLSSDAQKLNQDSESSQF